MRTHEQLTVYYKKKQIHRGPRGGFYWLKPHKRYWTHRAVEFVCKRTAPEQDLLPPDLWRIIWGYKESMDNFFGCNTSFLFLLSRADRGVVETFSQPDEHPIDAAIRLYPSGSHVARKAQRLLANF